MIRSCVYRAFACDNTLLYVGCTGSGIIERLGGHRSGSDWFNDIATVTVEHFESRRAALDAERVAIATEHPQHNVALSSYRPTDDELEARRTTRQTRAAEAAAKVEEFKRTHYRVQGGAICGNCNRVSALLPKGVLIADIKCRACGIAAITLRTAA